LGGEIKALVFDGPEEEALAYAIREKELVSSVDGVYLITGLQGLDGSGTRKLVSSSSSQCLIIAGFGESRQVHNAGALLS
jgi:hypothetical protein